VARRARRAIEKGFINRYARLAAGATPAPGLLQVGSSREGRLREQLYTDLQSARNPRFASTRGPLPTAEPYNPWSWTAACRLI